MRVQDFSRRPRRCVTASGPRVVAIRQSLFYLACVVVEAGRCWARSRAACSVPPPCLLEMEGVNGVIDDASVFCCFTLVGLVVMPSPGCASHYSPY